MLVSSKFYLQDAMKNHYAFPHFNYWDSNSIRAEIAAAEELKLPVILAWAQKHSAEISMEDALGLGKFFGAKAKVPVILHLDHGFTPELVKKGVDDGFTSVMIDASDKDFDTNVAITKDIAEYAHARGVVVEAEIGHVGTNSTKDDSKYTEVDAAKEFAEKTGVDSLAVSIGTSHGIYQTGTPKLNFKRLSELRAAMKIPLVLHGGSSSGDQNLQKAAELGITKVNIYTDLAMASLHATQKQKFVMEPDMAAAQKKAIKDLCEHYYHVFETDKYQYRV
ncbi:class II fructose-bisphosphate aldolase [Lactobacillus acetotolerans]|jgi:fructose-bisphosphate aldolase class II|uniref:class II fructose-bisphosphate aldolase n=1 Tax=Lactobacillus acetotolerans TaxID=1600 RepID=UPI000EC9C869|nr:class II fructose-bisphosphate aldolase [Lactobacillus acetotolerans]MBN7277011.1 ketose-bisphosphate aldolase [Lactobacillus acetotolerans]HCX39727.1 fructose-bisphosphate aldolase [Lactobacillus acetotolerans]